MTGTGDRIRDLVGEAMEEAWNEICSDTGCHPLDITHEGRKLFFHPAHWADATARIIERRVSDDVAYADLRASGGIFAEVANKPL